jgi:eukaryotic-like serine/threonine-protein kinase
MNCPSCNAALEPNARFCGVCGHQLSAAEAAARGAGGTSGASDKTVRARPASAAPPSALPAAAKSEPFNPGGKSVDPFLGTVLNNRFKIESKIGEGGFGAVYRGTQLATGRKVALKLLHPEMTKDKNLVARFRREGLVLCNLKDAHTITTYDFDQTADGTLYIAMELLEGKSLHQIFQAQAPLDWRRVFKIIGEMCSSLAEAHAQGIVHRDLKPENVYLEPRGANLEFVKILDFGIAKVMRGEAIDPQSPQLTATGQTLGTLEYMSPEQLMGKGLDGRSDVYALGVVAYEMITKRLPFPDAKGPAGLITAQLRQTPQPPSKANPSVSCPPIADKIILKCLEKDRNNRYADVTALATAVQEALQSAASSGPLPNMGMGMEDRRPGSGTQGEVAPAAYQPMQLPHLPQVPQGPHISPSPGLQAQMGPAQPSSAVPAAIPTSGSAPYPVPGGPPLAPMSPRSPTNRPLTGPVIGAMVPISGSAPGTPPHSMTPPQPMAPVGADSQRTWVMVMIIVVLLGAIAGAALAFLL